MMAMMMICYNRLDLLINTFYYATFYTLKSDWAAFYSAPSAVFSPAPVPQHPHPQASPHSQQGQHLPLAPLQQQQPHPADAAELWVQPSLEQEGPQQD